MAARWIDHGFFRMRASAGTAFGRPKPVSPLFPGEWTFRYQPTGNVRFHRVEWAGSGAHI
jgi:hypothetical protein